MLYKTLMLKCFMKFKELTLQLLKLFYTSGSHNCSVIIFRVCCEDPAGTECCEDPAGTESAISPLMISLLSAGNNIVGLC